MIAKFSIGPVLILSRFKGLAAVALAPGLLMGGGAAAEGQRAQGLVSFVQTSSLFGDDADGSVSDLVSSRSVATLFGIDLGANSGDFFAELTEEQQRKIIDRAYPNTDAMWPDTTIFVCWEELEPDFAADRAIVREAVNASWAAASALTFEGWGKCQETSVGIRISVQDIGPHASALGKEIDGLKNGLVLNFFYSVWEPACNRSAEIRDFCTRTTAVHEFGHAIGFSHEQNRPDTPQDCSRKARPQGEDGNDMSLTPWDPHSVMNYCNVDYLNNGLLSDFDKLAVREIYGGAG